MLPDFPNEKELLHEFWTNYIRQRQRQYMGVFSEVPTYDNYEGRIWTIEREDGTESTSDYHLVQSEFSLHVDEIPNMTPSHLAEKINDTARQLAGQAWAQLLNTLHTELESVGRLKHDAGAFTKDLYLESLESVMMSFDETGKPNLDILMSPQMWEHVKEVMKDWDTDPEFNKRYNEIIQRKKEKWRARENSRKLVS